MQLSIKVDIFSRIFSSFLKFKSNFRNFEKKDVSYRLCISEITDYQRYV